MFLRSHLSWPSSLVLVLPLICFSPTVSQAAYQAVDTTAFAALKWRNIGPFRSGRSVAVAGSVARSLAKTTPYFVFQIAHNILGVLFVVELGLMILLIAHWRKRWCRFALFLWLGYEIFLTVYTLGPRGRVVQRTPM